MDKSLRIFFFLVCLLFVVSGFVQASSDLGDQIEGKKCFQAGDTIPGVPDNKKRCCLGLVTRDIKEDFDDNCRSRGAGGYAGVCLACGDGICDSKFENKCNCPEDCGQRSLKKGN